MGADVLRLWIASADFSGEMTVSDEILKRAGESYRRIRNTARYLLSNINDFDPEKNKVEHNDLLALDRWAIDCAAELQDSIVDDYDNFQFHQIYQKLHNFCVRDMGGFYLDIIKDRIYTCAENSLPRRSAQTALYHIAEAFVRWIAPILSFTADEIWHFMPGDRHHSVFTAQWYPLQKLTPNEETITKHDWSVILKVKEAINKLLEEQRNQGVIKASLEANIRIFANSSLLSSLTKLGDELRFVTITSKVQLAPLEEADKNAQVSVIDGLKVSVSRLQTNKCIRCWHFTDDIGKNDQHPKICGRCIENIGAVGEIRYYA
jgi:isoleucyl-tRNA synthetase